MILEILEKINGNHQLDKLELEQKNFIAELKKIPQRDAEAMIYAKYCAKHPDTEFGKLAAIMARHKLNQPYMVWNWERMQKIAEVAIPLVQLIQRIDPKAKITAALDQLMEKNVVVSIKSGKYCEWGFFEDKMPEFRKILAGTDTFSIAPLLGEQLEVTFVFKGARKPE